MMKNDLDSNYQGHFYNIPSRRILSPIPTKTIAAISPAHFSIGPAICLAKNTHMKLSENVTIPIIPNTMSAFEMEYDR